MIVVLLGLLEMLIQGSRSILVHINNITAVPV